MNNGPERAERGRKLVRELNDAAEELASPIEHVNNAISVASEVGADMLGDALINLHHALGRIETVHSLALGQLARAGALEGGLDPESFPVAAPGE